jgi:hypothetical protein
LASRRSSSFAAGGGLSVALAVLVRAARSQWHWPTLTASSDTPTRNPATRTARCTTAATRNTTQRTAPHHTPQLAKRCVQAVDRVGPEDVDSLAKSAFPLCMQTLHEGMKAHHHLRHAGRMQYGLFLKGVGLTLEDALVFWQREFTQAMSVEEFLKKYAYNIRHNYGKEGKRQDYTPYSCVKIVMGTPPGNNEYHGVCGRGCGCGCGACFAGVRPRAMRCGLFLFFLFLLFWFRVLPHHVSQQPPPLSRCVRFAGIHEWVPQAARTGSGTVGSSAQYWPRCASPRRRSMA